MLGSKCSGKDGHGVRKLMSWEGLLPYSNYFFNRGSRLHEMADSGMECQ